MHLFDVTQQIELSVGCEATVGALEWLQFLMHRSDVGSLVPPLGEAFVTKVTLELFAVVG